MRTGSSRRGRNQAVWIVGEAGDDAVSDEEYGWMAAALIMVSALAFGLGMLAGRLLHGLW